MSRVALRDFHGAHSAEGAFGNDRQVLASSGKQSSLDLPEPPVDAPSSVLRHIESEADALAVSMHGKKLAYVAAKLGKSEGYVSRMRAGKRAIPDSLVDRICHATGTNLLRQYREFQAALTAAAEPSPNSRIASLARQIVRNIR